VHATRLRCAARALRTAACVAAVVAVGAAGVSSGTTPAAGSQNPPVYEFLIKSGVKKTARPESALLAGVITVTEGGQSIVKSTTRPISRRNEPDWLDLIQAGIISGTIVEPTQESVKVGSLDMTYSDGSKFTVLIYRDYFEITTTAGTIRFTSEPLTLVLTKLLK
jgi:hypothetical protein